MAKKKDARPEIQEEADAQAAYKKKASKQTPAELPEPEPEPEPTDATRTVTIALTDEHERHTEHTIKVVPTERDRVYRVEGVTYEAARQHDDGSWTYRKTTI